VVPHRDAMRVGFKMPAEPLGGETKVPPIFLFTSSAKEVVVSESPLRDGNRVVLRSDGPMVIQHRNAVLVAGANISGLLTERHVVLAQRMGWGILVDFSRVVPETKLTCAGQQVSASNAAIILQSFGNQHRGRQLARL
jgi:hypothetical protein